MSHQPIQVRDNANLGKNAQKEQLSMHKKISSQFYGDDGAVGEYNRHGFLSAPRN